MTKIKIACIGNMNNNFFSVVRYLRDRGYDAHLLLFDCEFAHFAPHTDTYNDDYKSYVHQLSWGHFLKVASTKATHIESDLKEYDVLIGCGAAPAYVEKIGRQIDIFIPYGGDIYDYPFFRLWRPKVLKSYLSSGSVTIRNKTTRIKNPFAIITLAMNYIYFFVYFRRALTRIPHMLFDASNTEIERQISKTPFRGIHHKANVPMLYHKGYANLTDIQASLLNNSTYNKQLQSLQNTDLVISLHNRHSWCFEPNSFQYKGTEKFLRGLAHTIHANPSKSIRLITFEYGPDVQASKDLINELGINDNVIWFPISERKYLMGIVSFADIVCGEFGYSYLTFGCVLEAMALSKPVLHYRDDALYPHLANDLYPLLNAHTETEISEQIEFALHHNDQLKQIGALSHKWYIEHAVIEPLSIIEKIISDITPLKSIAS